MYKFKQDEETTSSISDLSASVVSLIVRLFGFFLLMAGIWVASTVMLEALALYDNPIKIEALAVHIERGSNIDSSFAAIGSNDETVSETSPQASANSSVRVSYFFAWAIAILLLLLIGRLSLTAVKTGGELVLYDVQIKRFARELARESARGVK